MSRSILFTSPLMLAAVGLAAQVATQTPPPAPAPPPSLAQLGLFVYPAKGQTPDQQKKDEAACGEWAQAQTGIQVGTGTVNVDSAAKAAGDKTSQATQGAAVGGAARGAAGGAIVGAIAGDAGEGAAIGAVAGAFAGRRARKQATKQAEQQGAAQAQAANQAMVDQYKKAATACLEGRGYTVK